jgi:hypothetical protein
LQLGFTDIAASHGDLLLRLVGPEMLEQVWQVERRHEDCFGQELWRSPGACGGLVLMEGVRVKVVSEPAGHANVNTTLNKYAACIPNIQAGAALRVDAWLRQGVKGR